MIPKRICVLGGSTVHGQGDPGGGGFVSRLRSWHESGNPGRHGVFNLGVGGDGVREMFARGPSECLVRRADLIILYPGLNDTRRHVASGQPQQTSFEETNLLLQELFESLQRVAPLIVMSAVPIDESRTSPFLGKWFFRSDDAREMVKIVSDVATKSSVPYIPIYETFVTRNDLNELLADGLHCNVMGHDVLFQAVQKFLETRFIPS